MANENGISSISVVISSPVLPGLALLVAVSCFRTRLLPSRVFLSIVSVGSVRCAVSLIAGTRTLHTEQVTNVCGGERLRRHSERKATLALGSRDLPTGH